MRLTGNTVLITGGTSGIGRGLAEAFHQLGNRVVIAGRRQNLLDEITDLNPGMRAVQVDLEAPGAIEAFAATIRRDVPDLNVLINNAGIAGREDYTADAIDLTRAKSIIHTNIVSVLQLTAELLPVLKRQPAATVMTTTSGLAFMPLAALATYCASKAFLHSWLQSLRYQLRGSSVSVLELAPPYVQTELGGPQQLVDPRAMPLAEYIAEVMQLLGEANPPEGEILVERVKPLRRAERDGTYPQVFAQLNGMF